MRITNSSFNAQRLPRNPLVYSTPIRSVTYSLFNATGSRPGEPFFVAAYKSGRAYDYAEFEGARCSVKRAFEHAEIDHQTERNALWALNQLETVVYAPKVLSEPEGNVSFEWATDQGFALLQIGPAHYEYHLKPLAGTPMAGTGDARAVDPGIGILLDAVIYPTPVTPWMADPAVSRLAVGCTAMEGVPIITDSLAKRAGSVASKTCEALALSEMVDFVDGIENELTLRITELVKTDGTPAVNTLVRLLREGDYKPETIAQVLLCLGRIHDAATYRSRSSAVREGLASTSAKVRDAATIAIDSMLDRSAEDDLRIAIRRESVPSLRHDMETVLGYLQSAS